MNTITLVKFDLTAQQHVEAAEKFLQGQITADVNKLTDAFQITAICNLKGRVDFGIWVARKADVFEIVIAADCADDFTQHIKKYGAFSKIVLSEAVEIYPNDIASFATTVEATTDWQANCIDAGQPVITQQTRALFQPQELRLHQLGLVGGVHYDKGCYLGQEVIARLWFKAAPKAWLHKVSGQGETPTAGEQLDKGIQVVNVIETSTGYEALVVAKPDALTSSELTILDLPDSLNKSVARQS